MPRSAFLLVVLVAAGCAADSPSRYSATTAAMDKDATAAAGEPVPLDPTRPIAVQDCSKPIEALGGNLSCR